MKKMISISRGGRCALFCSTIVLTLTLTAGCGDDKTTATPAASDLAGTWHMHSLTTGVPELDAWARGTVTLDNSGNAIIAWKNADGASGTEIDQFMLSHDGILREPDNGDFLGLNQAHI